MNLHQITVTAPTWLWIAIESLTTYREAGSHLWNPRDTPIPPFNADNPQSHFDWLPFNEISQWNREGRAPAALCGYRPRRNSMRVTRYAGWNHCRTCEARAYNRGILTQNITAATRNHPTYMQLQREYNEWMTTHR